MATSPDHCDNRLFSRFYRSKHLPETLLSFCAWSNFRRSELRLSCYLFACANLRLAILSSSNPRQPAHHSQKLILFSPLLVQLHSQPWRLNPNSPSRPFGRSSLEVSAPVCTETHVQGQWTASIGGVSLQ